MKERVARIKKSVVRVVAGNSVGTGFVVASDGLIATCSHVVREVEDKGGGNVNVIEAKNITVQWPDGTATPAEVHTSSKGTPDLLKESVTKDFALLHVQRKDLVPLRLGKFEEASEGSEVYLAGFPLGIEQIVVARGMLSTKWTDPLRRDVAWLDIGMNEGNSGGPVILPGERPEDDVVVGIVTFNLNPFARPAQDLKKQAETFPPGSAHVAGIDLPSFGRLVAQALTTNSLKVGGCVSIEYLKRSMPKR